jgi:hypothetical protein
MIESKLKFFVFLFKNNDLKVKVLVDEHTEIPELEINNQHSIKSLTEQFCNTSRIPVSIEDFKLADCQINNSILEVCYYVILPFGYTDPCNNFVDIDNIGIDSLPNLKKIIRLL